MMVTGINLRNCTAAVFNPSNVEVDGLTRQLERIGMRVKVTSTDTKTLSAEPDFLLAVVTSGGPCTFPKLSKGARTVLVAILDSETPTVLDWLATLDIDAVLVKPIRPSGLLATLVLARRQWDEKAKLRGELDRLYRKLRGFRQVEKAKEIVAASRNVSPDQAFAIIREQAMHYRTTVECIAEKLVDAHQILSAEPKRLDEGTPGVII